MSDTSVRSSLLHVNELLNAFMPAYHTDTIRAKSTIVGKKLHR
jgi:hypothetical protein